MKKGVVASFAFLTLVLLFVAVQVLKKDVALAPSLVNIASLRNLSVRNANTIDTSHLADGLVPPTNKWFSGIALQAKPRTIFPSPLSFSMTDNSFSFSVPKVIATTDTISAASDEVVTVSITQASSYMITRYDELSVDITYFKDREELVTLTLVAGSPYLQMSALNDARVTLRSTAATVSGSPSTILFNSATRTYVAAGFNGVSMQQQTSEASATLPAKGLITFFGIPADQSITPLMAYADTRITGAHVSYSLHDNIYATDIHIKTENGKPTILGHLPHHIYKENSIVQYDTIYGLQKMHVGSHFIFNTTAVPVVNSLTLGGLSDNQKALLVKTLRQEINATRFTATDTYFSGKELYRSAQLLKVARQLNEKQIATTIQAKLYQELTTWLSVTNDRTKKYFYYDSKVQSIVGETVAFGSEDINDHHFHYGYFIYAASILAEYDTTFLASYRDQIDLLVADIANYKSGEALPLRRMFDPYFGHSWASGSSPFDAGNNQESVSEALNAWIGTALWAKQTGNAELELHAGWMLSAESSAARTYWLDIASYEAPYNSAYQHSIVSLNWGGKRDYATFFSPEPAAKLGILLIPMSPTMQSIMPRGNVVTAQVHEAIADNYDVQFGDYILMYDALNDIRGKLEIAQDISDKTIDSANSRSYLLAWIMSKQ